MCSQLYIVPMMAADRPRSWMDEVGANPPRRPSVPGPLIPFDIASTPKTVRSQSYAMGQNRAVLAWQRGVAEAHPGASRDDTDIEKRNVPSPSSYRPTFLPDLSPTEEKNDMDNLVGYFANLKADMEDVEFCVVEFKAFRAELYRLPKEYMDQAGAKGVSISHGDVVVVEADRGFDLGVVIQITKNLLLANNYKNIMNEQHDKVELLASTRFSHVVTNRPLERPAPPSPTNPLARKDPRDMPSKPESLKLVRRRANDTEIMALRDKEGLEMKAKRYCQTKAKDHRLDMEIVDAEFQHDYNKLTFFFVAPSYITFNNLVQDLFRQFKTRIWMSQIHVSVDFLNQPKPSPKPMLPPPPQNANPNSPWNAPGTSSKPRYRHGPPQHLPGRPDTLVAKTSSLDDTAPVVSIPPRLSGREYQANGFRVPPRIPEYNDWQDLNNRYQQHDPPPH